MQVVFSYVVVAQRCCCHVCFDASSDVDVGIDDSLRGEAKAMLQSRKCAEFNMTKELVGVLLRRLRTFYANAMRVSVLNIFGRVENKLIDFFPTRRATWERLQNAESLDVL